MILQFLAATRIASGVIRATRENDEARLPVGANGAHHHQSLQSHICACTAKAIGQQTEGVDCIDIVARDRDGAVEMTGQWYGERCPDGTDLACMLGQRFMYIGTDAVDVDVQLVLRPGDVGVDCEAHPVAWQRLPGAFIDEGTRPPRCGEVVGRAGRQDRRTFDAADGLGGDQQKLRPPVDVLEHGVPMLVSSAEIDRRSGGGIVVLLLIWNAAVMNDRPERVRIGIRAANAKAPEYNNDRGREKRLTQRPDPRRRHTCSATCEPHALPFPAAQPTASFKAGSYSGP